MRARCIRCGNRKRASFSRCTRCGLKPQGEDVVKSVYLSEERFEDDGDRERYARELDRVAANLEQGQPPFYIEAELERLRQEKQAFEEFDASPRTLLRALFRIFRPLIIGFALLFAVYFLFRFLKHGLQG